MNVNRFGSDIKIEWHDKKHIWGMPISFTYYNLISKPYSWCKLFITTGVFSSHDEEVNIFRVFDLSVYQSLIDKMFNVGTIKLYCKDESQDEVYLYKVKNPYKVRNLIAQKVEEERKKRGFRVGEFHS